MPANFPDAPPPQPGCPFCERTRLETMLHATEHFFLLADFAPLTEGHLLIVPRDHYACYGAVPAALDGELRALKALVAAFFRATYRGPVFFEHGVFHQTVFHAHLHAQPFGALGLNLPALAQPDGQLVERQDDIRRWYAERGHYFYLEEAADPALPPVAALFPANERRYFAVLNTLREHTGRAIHWAPPLARRMQGRGQVQALMEKWRAYTAAPITE